MSGLGYTIQGEITNSYSTGDVEGSNAVGGLVGKGSYIENSFSTCTVSAIGDYIGGLAGDNGLANYCFATGNVTGNNYVGGLIGESYGRIIDSYASGNILGNTAVGGLAGSNIDSSGLGIVSNCYSSGNISGTTDIGGLVGNDAGGTYTKSFWDSTLNPTLAGIGNISDPNVIGKTTLEIRTQSTFTGWDFTTPVWVMLRPGEDYPRLAWQEVFMGDIAGLYGVDMVDFAYLANYWGLSGCNSGTDCGRADIDGSGTVDLPDLAAVANDWLK